MEENINNCTASLSPEKREKEGLRYFKGQNRFDIGQSRYGKQGVD